MASLRGLVAVLVLAAAAVAGSALAGGAAQKRQAIVAPPTYQLQPWRSSTDNLVPAQGTVVLNGTTAVVVPATAVTANSRIFLTIQSPAGTPGSPYVSARSAGVSFSVKSTAGDTSTCAWFILEPGT